MCDGRFLRNKRLTHNSRVSELCGQSEEQEAWQSETLTLLGWRLNYHLPSAIGVPHDLQGSRTVQQH